MELGLQFEDEDLGLNSPKTPLLYFIYVKLIGPRMKVFPVCLLF
jgi:hypothetical protein